MYFNGIFVFWSYFQPSLIVLSTKAIFPSSNPDKYMDLPSLFLYRKKLALPLRGSPLDMG